MTFLDTMLIGIVCALMGSVITSVVWSHAAFARYTVIAERLAVLETKMDMMMLRHEAICVNFKPKGRIDLGT